MRDKFPRPWLGEELGSNLLFAVLLPRDTIRWMGLSTGWSPESESASLPLSFSSSAHRFHFRTGPFVLSSSLHPLSTAISLSFSLRGLYCLCALYRARLLPCFALNYPLPKIPLYRYTSRLEPPHTIMPIVPHRSRHHRSQKTTSVPIVHFPQSIKFVGTKIHSSHFYFSPLKYKAALLLLLLCVHTAYIGP